MATDDVFGEDELRSSNSQGQSTQAIHTSTERVTDKSWSKNVKLGFLALISFAIPVIFFLQANELKKKELKNVNDLRGKDSLQLQLNNYYDTSLQNAKILAYKAYIMQFSTLVSNGENVNRNSLYDSNKIADQIQGLSSKINIISNEVSTIRSHQGDQLTKANLPPDILSSTHFDTQIKLINSEIAQIKIDIENLHNRPVFNDSLKSQLSYFNGQINQFDKRLADLRLLYGIKNDTIQQPRKNRQSKIQNQFVIDKTQLILDSIISDLNTINKMLR